MGVLYLDARRRHLRGCLAGELCSAQWAQLKTLSHL